MPRSPYLQKLTQQLSAQVAVVVNKQEVVGELELGEEDNSEW